MEPKEKKAFEPSGLVPRSIVRTFERFRQQLLPGSETAAIREYRISRYQVLVSARCLFTLLIIPIATNWLVSSWLLSPLVEHFWNTQQNEIFLNSYQEERAFAELESFSKKLFFESLLNTTNTINVNSIPDPNFATLQLGTPSKGKGLSANAQLEGFLLYPQLGTPLQGIRVKRSFSSNGVPAFYKSSICAAKVNSPFNKFSKAWDSSVFDPIETSYPVQSFALQKGIKLVNTGVKAWGTEIKTPSLLSTSIESTYDNSLKIKEKVQNKILELAIYYNQQTIISITNIVGDVVSLVTLGCLFIWMKPEITILKSFLIEAIYSLSDTTKSFLLILLTDLLVGFHSPRGWETALELLLKHFGLPENQDFVFLFVATFPVLLDTVFKYWIFRHLNKISPSTVATYHSMIE